jgi:putative Ca2+/H+ antiporter (TMEM165/GDT1 family)
VHVISTVLFLAGAVILLRAASRAADAEAEQEEEFAARATEERSGWRAVTTSFLILFAAEWGDLSQLLTLNLVAKYGSPLSVFIGAWAALLAVSGLAVLAGRVLLRYVPLSLLHYIAGGVCLLLAGVGVYQLATL